MFTILGTLVVLAVEQFVSVILPVFIVFVLLKFFFANSDEPDKRWGEWFLQSRLLRFRLAMTQWAMVCLTLAGFAMTQWANFARRAHGESLRCGQ